MMNSVIGALVPAFLVCAMILALRRDMGRRRLEREAADERDEHDERVSLFLDELKSDAAFATVCDFPYAGNDLLSMLNRHELLTSGEETKLIADATARMPDVEDDGPIYVHPPATNGHRRPPMDDEIPF